MKSYEQTIRRSAERAVDNFLAGDVQLLAGIDSELIAFVYDEPNVIVVADIMLDFKKCMDQHYADAHRNVEAYRLKYGLTSG